jgi:phenylglyoxylate dehydrogenase epsilon subunit
MQQTDYLIIGASHAALSALHTLRMHDAEGAVTMVTRDASLPYSPTVLPYVVSGRSAAERVFLRDEGYFREQKVNYLRGAQVESVAADRNTVRLAGGGEIGYGKLLVASGARPVVPPIPGLASAFRAARWRRARPARRAAGDARRGRARRRIIGMHAAATESRCPRHHRRTEPRAGFRPTRRRSSRDVRAEGVPRQAQAVHESAGTART